MSILADDDDNIPLIDVQSSAGMQQGMREGGVIGTQLYWYPKFYKHVILIVG